MKHLGIYEDEIQLPIRLTQPNSGEGIMALTGEMQSFLKHYDGPMMLVINRYPGTQLKAYWDNDRLEWTANRSQAFETDDVSQLESAGHAALRNAPEGVGKMQIMIEKADKPQ